MSTQTGAGHRSPPPESISRFSKNRRPLPSAVTCLKDADTDFPFLSFRDMRSRGGLSLGISNESFISHSDSDSDSANGRSNPADELELFQFTAIPPEVVPKYDSYKNPVISSNRGLPFGVNSSKQGV